MKTTALSRWTVEDSAEAYFVRNWGSQYFDISEDGHVIVRPGGRGSTATIDLYHVVKELAEKNCNMPVLIRFADILAQQIHDLNISFRNAIKDAKYKGTYQAIFPIKVNQKQLVVEDIMEFGRKFHHGLEAGSKAELIAAVASNRNPKALLICNGYKDEEFIDLALYASMLGSRVILVVEMPDELDLIIERARVLGISPSLGVRAKLSSKAGGHWDSSGGDRSKFGLDASQIVDVVEKLKKENMLDCLNLLHYHIGSQVSDIRRIRNALREAARIYVDLAVDGAPMGIINIGGGLAVDYDGSHTNFDSSSNYSMQEYATDVVEVVMSTADEHGIPHPLIVSESGRATVAHHSVLVFNVLDVRRFEQHSIPRELADDSNHMLLNLLEAHNSLTPRNYQEIYHDAVYYRDELRAMFLHGDASLRERATGEDIFWHIIRRIANIARDRKYTPDEMEGLDQAIADVYYCNFSLFQSLPDSWAVDQLFPVMPIHRLNENPVRQGVLADITCDSDGKIDRFIDLHDVRRILPLHELNREEYYIGVFLVGAYQETLGDMHNLLGTTNVIHIRVDENGEANITGETPGDSVGEVLSFVEYKPAEMMRRIRARATRAHETGRLSEADRNAVVAAFKCGLDGYTYFER
jgi:arginine decarboxylase